jgi:dephospho-CoA kinase
MLVIGITGGTGSGKTTLLRCVLARGGRGIDCDRLYDELLRRSPPLRQALRGAFGDIFLPDGALDRAALAARVFSSPAELARLNEIVYLHVGRAADEALARARADGCRLFAIDAVNLVQGGLAARCRAAVGVLAPAEVRAARIMARDGISREAALRRIRAQASDGFYRENCRYLLENPGGSEAAFTEKANSLLDIIIKENEP